MVDEDAEVEEHPLSGGNVTAGIVRVGATVRRPAGPWTPAVHALLSHLRDVGFEGAPGSLGIDEQGRHVLEWVDGVVTHPYSPVSSRSPSLAEVGRLIRRFHDAVVGFVPPEGAVWNTVIEPDDTTLIVHHDLASWNFVHGGGRSAFIDWDSAGPGSALWDLAWAAQGFAGLDPGTSIAVAGGRLRALVDGYGLDDGDRVRLVEMLPVRYGAMYDLLSRSRLSGAQPWERLWSEGHGVIWDGIRRFVSDQQQELLASVRA